MALNKNLQVRSSVFYTPRSSANAGTDLTGDQHPEHGRRTCRPDVQELPIQCAFPPRRYIACYAFLSDLSLPTIHIATDSLQEPS